MNGQVVGRTSARRESPSVEWDEKFEFPYLHGAGIDAPSSSLGGSVSPCGGSVPPSPVERGRGWDMGRSSVPCEAIECVVWKERATGKYTKVGGFPLVVGGTDGPSVLFEGWYDVGLGAGRVRVRYFGLEQPVFELAEYQDVKQVGPRAAEPTYRKRN